jgi:hypothetical protein
VGAIIATLAVTTLIIKFNWYDKLEKAPGRTPAPGGRVEAAAAAR